jgi:hypothetical protein
MKPWIRRLAAATAGGLSAAVLVESVVYPALGAIGRSWELGAVPALLSTILFAPVLAAIIAGLVQPVQIYLTAVTAYVVIAATAAGYVLLQLQPTILVFVATGWGLPLALWGALLVDARPSGRAQRLRGLRDLSYGPACLMTVFAILPPCVHWLPEPHSVIIAWSIPAGFFLWLAARNRRASTERKATTILQEI